MMKFYILLCFVAFQLQGQNTDFSFLEGTWKVADKDVYETWSILENGNLKGKAYQIIDGNEKIAETLDLNKLEGAWTYYATVVGQNNGETIPFKLKRIDDTTFSFENLEHNFPKRIMYQKVSEDKLFIQVSGKKSEVFEYYMLKEQQVTTN